MDLYTRRQLLAGRHQRALDEYAAAWHELAELSQPDPLTGRVWRTSEWRAARFRFRRSVRAVRRSQPRPYTR